MLAIWARLTPTLVISRLEKSLLAASIRLSFAIIVGRHGSVRI